MNLRYPVYAPYLNGREKHLVMDCLESTWISSKGKYVGQFEESFAAWLGARHAITVSNGTVALHVALAALGIGPGDEVLVPTLTYIASANAVKYTGADVVFVDSERDYWQIDVEDAERKITSKTKAIMAVHLYGQATDMEAVMALAKKHSLYVIEDCAEAIGTRFDGANVGTFGDIGCFSFFGNKTITTGEGGMVVTNDAELDRKIRHLRSQGVSSEREYWHDAIGFNYRMTNLAAAIGCAQMESVDDLIAKKQQIAEWYRQSLAGLPLQVHSTHPRTLHSYWMVSILVEDASQRDPLRAALLQDGIETRPLFYPVHQMKMYAAPGQHFPVADEIASRGINLPSYPALMRDDIAFICERVRDFLARQESNKEPLLETKA
ncbi:DegT/DnrJ/EryC1/StrS family aminotransferase [Paraburkholderia sp. UYCP14C]|uniref:DegT/DnrJ/EryC1/StrS family aminotransferase n=1 Tax=Paraburkholderia sp. UYCP14C TaxID=2511130 RepID=UPI00101FCE4B|nr:DegT/DnrJ/EryC1/StrS family aminotransferase [Paraburkholderia sp. UYCP14C]RZF30729.1 DegT/DnrJ/EryC1/StrS family aminotransferase [Paraburkholderia sp. UYCP14C]